MTSSSEQPTFHNERNSEDPDVETVALEDDDGEATTLAQQNVGPGNEVGQGEFPDPDTPPLDEADAAAEQDRIDRDARQAGVAPPS